MGDIENKNHVKEKIILNKKEEPLLDTREWYDEDLFEEDDVSQNRMGQLYECLEAAKWYKEMYFKYKKKYEKLKDKSK